ncbi:LysR substrate-binding domain-containing protein [Labrys wisconsinensis]|uniref:DNA-binding transcriptional LysR family regulator n=1 Tax=Labrys wisconsinensis TaxID=425677 RepID=A0ABU0J5Q0_9HYPH|nr:LysR substrate-binding domain-containing protein [Labrys wisconsinensis]MDQ0469581.1 DNA-binding transcriptional LysR family regulator [Labrys wisconsinensis]
MLKDVSLSSVRAFEAAARNGSFRAAASELNLSPSAISHAIVKLEQALGTNLFEREGRLVRLTSDGEMLMRHVGTAFDELRRGMEAVSTRGPQLLRLHSAPSFAAQWLSPRLARFFALHPDIEVRLAASTDYARFTTDEFDADIVYGPPRSDGVLVVPLGEEVVTPLCAPALAASIRTAADLAGKVLIQSDSKLVRWPAWFEANGMTAPAPHGTRFDRSFLAIAAAVDGLGVALESTRLAEREIAAGRLVAPLAGKAEDVRYVGHRLVYPRAGRQRRAVRLFAAWLLGELGLAADGVA